MTEHSATVAFVTMVRDDDFFLQLWVNHYSQHVPKQQLFILFDGFDQIAPPAAEGCQVIYLPRGETVQAWERRRRAMLADFTATLLSRFPVVVVTDVDEILTTDPAQGHDLLSVIEDARELGVISPFALEIMHRPSLEPAALDLQRPILERRRFARVNASYCKPCITSQPIRWSNGGHYSTYPEFHLDERLYLFHLRFIDRDRLLDRQRKRHEMIQTKASDATEGVAGISWSKPVDTMEKFMASFEERPPVDNDFDFGWHRRRIASEWYHDEEVGVWRHQRLHNRKTYRIPDRFVGLF